MITGVKKVYKHDDSARSAVQEGDRSNRLHLVLIVIGGTIGFSNWRLSGFGYELCGLGPCEGCKPALFPIGGRVSGDEDNIFANLDHGWHKSLDLIVADNARSELSGPTL